MFVCSDFLSAAVPKPTVSTQCSSEGTRCTFTCEANVTGAKPVTYSWMVDGKNRDESSKSLEKEKVQTGSACSHKSVAYLFYFMLFYVILFYFKDSFPPKPQCDSQAAKNWWTCDISLADSNKLYSGSDPSLFFIPFKNQFATVYNYLIYSMHMVNLTHFYFRFSVNSVKLHQGEFWHLWAGLWCCWCESVDSLQI